MTLPSHFYAVADPLGAADPAALVALLLDAGARIIQLRLKEAPSRDFLEAARAAASLCRERGALFIVNDRADIAMLADADGVHLGQDDLPIEAARGLLKHGAIIGISAHSAEQAIRAEASGVDYIGFGPIYPGGAKQNPAGLGLEAIRRVRAAVKIPIVAIGGITEDRVTEVLEAGADAVAIISDVVRAPDPRAKVRAILKLHPTAR